KGIKPRRPPLSVRSKPVVDFVERSRRQAIGATRCIGAYVDESALAQNAELLGDGGLAQGEARDEVANGPFAGEQGIKDAAAVRFGDEGKWGSGHGRIVSRGYIRVKAYTMGRLPLTRWRRLSGCAPYS